MDAFTGKADGSDNSSGYTEKEGEKIDALVDQAITLFRSWKDVEPGMALDASLVAVAMFIGTGWKDREALERNLPRLVESFQRVMRYSFDEKARNG